MSKYISVKELEDLLDSSEVFALIDVRERVEYEREQIFGSTQISRSKLETLIPTRIPDKDTHIVLYSGEEGRATLAADLVGRAGYSKVSILQGGLKAYKESGREIVSGIHVLSKAYGEIAGEIEHGVISITPDTLKLWQKKDECLVVEVRPREEVEKTGSVPGAVNAPGLEALVRLPDFLKAGKRVVFTCAGRTRGIIASTSAGRFDLGQVYDLENGTLGWQLAGYDLEPADLAGEPSDEAVKLVNEKMSRLAEKEGIEFIEPEKLKALLETSDKPVTVVDVRQQGDYETKGHIKGSLHYPGGQVVQNVDDLRIIYNGIYVFVCEDSSRSIMTAYWYRRMGIPNVYVLRGGLDNWAKAGYETEKGKPHPVSPLLYEEALKDAAFIDADKVKGSIKDKLIIDVGDGRSYAAGHIEGAKWIPRGRLEERIKSVSPDSEEEIIVTSTLPEDSVYAAYSLKNEGFKNVLILKGSKRDWEAFGLRIETEDKKERFDDWHTMLTEYGEKEAIAYFRWEESLSGLKAYMNYFEKRGLIPSNT